MQIDPMLSPFSPSEKNTIKAYLSKRYENIFPLQNIENHFYNYVGSASHEMPVALLNQFLAPSSSVLDIGSGFGTFATLAIGAGYQCTAIEPAAFEVEMARCRLRRLYPMLDAENIFRVGKAHDLAELHETFDAVTLWNVLEHIPNTRNTLELCSSLLKSHGRIFIVCPNYFSFRKEAHYQISWSPFSYFCNRIFIKQIESNGRVPSYFEHETVQVTNWSILFLLWRLGFTIYDFSGIRISFRASKSLSVMMRRMAALSPLAHSVCVIAQKDV